MSASNYYKEYQKNAVVTSNQGKLILMMYDGAIKFINLAIQSMEKEDVGGRGKYIQKTQDIINELSLSLDLEKGGEVAKKLEGLYRFILQQLTLANIKSDKETLESTLKILTPLRDAWDEIFKREILEDGEPPPTPTKTKGITAKC